MITEQNIEKFFTIPENVVEERLTAYFEEKLDVGVEYSQEENLNSTIFRYINLKRRGEQSYFIGFRVNKRSKKDSNYNLHCLYGFNAVYNVFNRIINRILSGFNSQTFMTHVLKCYNFFFYFFLS